MSPISSCYVKRSMRHDSVVHTLAFCMPITINSLKIDSGIISVDVILRLPNIGLNADHHFYPISHV